MTDLECPCCGDVAAESDADGCFYDGQPLICGCAGIVSCDGETPAGVSMEVPCDNCLENDNE